MTDKLAWVDEELQALRDAGLYNNIRTLGSPQGAWLDVDGKRVLNFCSNNYLGLANHPRIAQAAKAAIDKMGVGPGAVRTIAGTTESVYASVLGRKSNGRVTERHVPRSLLPGPRGGDNLWLQDIVAARRGLPRRKPQRAPR